MTEYRLVAIKRGWVPEWLWWFFRGWIPYQPFRWIFAKELDGEDDQ